ncbi:MAG: M20/M25/M40 family metallo-hydrolase [Chloroflexi bacterium]|nr:M20/M25/M40 family metallo-hydrolase [Chloroflexota bacterium]
MLIDRARLLATLRKLLEIESPSGKEADVARYVVAELTAMGGKVVVDATGNVIARFAGEGEPVLLSAHLDTVLPTTGLRIVESDGKWRSDGTTILGADDKTGVAAILEAIRSLREKQVRHSPVEVVFTLSEEIGLIGAKALDCSQITARRGICLDSSGPVGTVIVSGPSQISLDITVTGKAAHAGMAPERGINAIAAAAEAIAGMHLGRIDEQTTANVGVIHGGTARNIVPEKATVLAEARSRDENRLRAQVDLMTRAFKEAAARHGAVADVSTEYAYRSFNLSQNDEVVHMVAVASKKLGIDVHLGAGGGGSDANVFNERGIKTVNLGIGYEDPHSPSEYVVIADLVRSAELLCAALSL